MRRARVVHAGREIDVVVGDDGRPRAGDGTMLDPAAVGWLPPRTPLVLGLALNYADHAAELDFTKRPDHPILFIKNPTSLIGHRTPVVRPMGVEYMHYEGELGVVIGRPAHKVRRGDALDYVSGYTVCNDVTVRDFVENFYRPPVKAKGFDTFGPIGPWIVDAADVAHPEALAVRTWVNGELRQDGNTRDLLFDVPALIEYASDFMTLPAGSIISTGTPRGISNVVAGDVMVVEVEGVGRLENPVVEASAG